MGRFREKASTLLWVLPSLLIPLGVAATSWTTHVAGEGSVVAPNVRFAGLDVSGLVRADAANEVARREEHFLATPVAIDLGERSVVLDAGEIGYDYLYTDTVGAVVAARHGDGMWDELTSWAATPFDEVTVADRYTLDEAVARERLTADDFVLDPAEEPRLTTEGSAEVTVVPGVDGVTVDIDQVIAELRDADIAAGTVEIDADLGALPPTVADEDAEALAAEVNRMTESGLKASVGPITKVLPPTRIRDHVMSTVDDEELRLTIDLAGFQEAIEATFTEPVGEFVPPVLEVVDGEIRVLTVGEPAPVCCSAESVAAVAEAFLGGGADQYVLQPRPDVDETVLLWADGSQIVEEVASFTTRHPCCEARVTNIQTMADTLTGVYLIPGQRLSLNELVGPRTREKGYVAAGAIRGGYMTDEVGGGVSQFTTTIFNAAYFGGLELNEYQSHSIYFSRYPFGREATLSMPGPDLVVTNTTDYPILIWSTYDSNSITVTLYSTDHIEVVELDQRVSRFRQCTRSEIDRQRTYPDGRVVVDTIEAFYRPANGIDCNGNVIPET